MALEIKLEAFEGPLDLLLRLIEKNRVDITDIPIVEITEQYLDAIRKMEKKSEITEDDLKDAETQLQKLTDQQVKDLDAIGAEKEKEIMSV